MIGRRRRSIYQSKSHRTAFRQCALSFLVPDEKDSPSSVRWRACSLRRRKFARNASARRSVRKSAAVFWSPEAPVLPDFTIEGECRWRGVNSSQETCLHLRSPCGMVRRVLQGAVFAVGFFATKCCRSSGVEHSLGKGEVECSNHSGSTIISIILDLWKILVRKNL